MDERTNEMYSDSGEALGYDLMKYYVDEMYGGWGDPIKRTTGSFL
jgi:hypothetical protein